MAVMSKSMFGWTKEAECNEKNTCPAVGGGDGLIMLCSGAVAEDEKRMASTRG